MIPKAFVKQKRRKICLEVRKVYPPGGQTSCGAGITDKGRDGDGGDGGDALTYEECVFRVLDPANRATKRSVKRRLKDRLKGRIHFSGGGETSASFSGNADNGGVEVVLDEDDDDSASVAVGVPAEFLDNGLNYGAECVETGVQESWQAKYRFPIKAIKLVGSHPNRNCVTLEITSTKNKLHQTRSLIFDTADEAYDFYDALKREQGKEGERARQRLNVNLDGTQISKGEKLTFLIEIVSGWDLPTGDKVSSDPYVKCSLDGVPIHETKYISKTYVFIRTS